MPGDLIYSMVKTIDNTKLVSTTNNIIVYS